MKRRDFILQGCKGCLAVAGVSSLVSSCQASRIINGTLHDNGLVVSKSEFDMISDGKKKHRLYIIVRNDALQYPICVYRFSEADFAALWMQCTHQGTELQVAGDLLQCPAHGSEFNSRGQMVNGPADANLRSFPIQINNHEIFIDLRKP